MKKLGLIGGIGPESTLIYYRELEYGVQQKLGSAIFPRITIESMSVFEVLSFCRNQDYEGLTEYLLEGIQNLKNAGVEYAALTGITPHIVFEHLESRASIPVVSMIDTAALHAQEQGYKKIGLLGTQPTMSGSFFQDAFAKRNIEVITPRDEEKQFIGTKIETELEYGKLIPETREKMVEIVNRLIAQENIEAVVLGCTELPLIFDQTNLSVPQMDVMRIHIDALIELIIHS